MGVPSFFRWLVQRCPQILINAMKPERDDDGQTRERNDEPNVNGFEFDNLYLDMNGIIHPCVHPENGVAPATEEAMVEAIFQYIDVIFSIVRPRRVLYMAIDGVAPRAKMNQQRSRRFKSIKEARLKAELEAELLAQLDAELKQRGLPPRDTTVAPTRPAFDHNCITPGTLFMAKIAAGLRYYVSARQVGAVCLLLCCTSSHAATLRPLIQDGRMCPSSSQTPPFQGKASTS